MNKILILTATESKEDNARRIAKLLVQTKMAACISLKRISSIYSWDGNIEEANEIEIVIKSKPELLEQIIKTLKKEISYEIPQILYGFMESEKGYHDWCKNYLEI